MKIYQVLLLDLQKQTNKTTLRSIFTLEITVWSLFIKGEDRTGTNIKDLSKEKKGL